ncbi:Ethylene-insensitive protein 2 [Zea mays]|nr:Ethylene-insensitive protein 2 [Zea mays]
MCTVFLMPPPADFGGLPALRMPPLFLAGVVHSPRLPRLTAHRHHPAASISVCDALAHPCSPPWSLAHREFSWQGNSKRKRGEFWNKR